MSIWAPRSLAAAVYWRVGLLVTVVGLLMAGISFFVADQELDRAADGQLITGTNVLLALMQDELAEASRKGPTAAAATIEIDDRLLSAEDARAFHAAADWRMFAVFERGRVVLRSDTGPPDAALPRQPGFHDFKGHHRMWRSYGLALPRYDLLLIVGERLHARHRVLNHIAAALAVPMIALLPATAFLLWITLASGLTALRRLSADLSHRSSQELAPFDPAMWPTDMAALIAALNRLFARLDDAFEHEQGITDDAAHQLRTPLAAMRIQAQTLAAALPPETREQGHDLLLSIDRAASLIDRMLLLARLDVTAVLPARFDLRDAIVDVISGQVLVAARKDVEFAFERTEALFIISDAAILEMALAAICENAVKHAPEGSLVEIDIAADASGAVAILVQDRGPGIPPHERERVLQRFARGSRAETGAGLGLAIARRAMGLLGGGIGFEDRPDGGGLAVRLTLPDMIAE